MIRSATATEFNRVPSKLLGHSKRGDTILVNTYGEPTAAIIPHPARTSGAECARQLRRLKPDPKTADIIAGLIKGMDKAA